MFSLPFELPKTALGVTVGATLIAMNWSHAWAGSQYVVVSAEPASEEFPPGLILEVDDSIIVPEGTVVTLLGEDGSVNAIPGPASITVTEESVETDGADGGDGDQKRSAISKISALLSGEKENADTLGVARNLTGDKPKPRGLVDPWVVSIHGDGPGCVRDSEIRLGRNDDGETLSVSLEGDKGSEPRILTWRSGEPELTVPESLPIDAGEIFVRAGTMRSLITINSVPQEINMKNPVAVLGWMIETGCEGQALAFSRQLVLEAQ